MMGQRFILKGETYKLSHCSMISKAGNKPEIKTSYRSGCCNLESWLWAQVTISTGYNAGKKKSSSSLLVFKGQVWCKSHANV